MKPHAHTAPHLRRSPATITFTAAICLILSPTLFAGDKMAGESARQIPIAYDVDVVVVGGTSGGVAAAVAAAEQGAKVFLAAGRPYLGEDICATYRLWLEPDEEPSDPLAKEIFDIDPPLEGIPYTYQADQPSAGKHKDTQPSKMLNDGHSFINVRLAGERCCWTDLKGEER